MFQNTSFSQLANLVTNLKFLNCNFDQITQLCLEETTEQQTDRVRGVLASESIFASQYVQHCFWSNSKVQTVKAATFTKP